MRLAVHDFNSSKQDYVNKLIVEAFSVQSLSLCQIYDTTVMKDNLDCLKSKFAENWMEVMKAKVRNVDLDILILLEHALFEPFLIELFFDFKESFLDLLLDLWLELFLHIVHL
jgi:hypothetical protein